MSKLVVNPGTTEAFELPLKSGGNSVGRSPENDLSIEHETVSGRHCEILVGELEVQLFDLDSVEGTFVEGARVEQVTLQDGQRFRLGQVELQFLGDPAGSPQPTIPTEPMRLATTCRFHPKSAAQYFCQKCGKAYCMLCVGRQMINGQSVVCCHHCGTPCIELAQGAEEAQPAPFRELAMAAFKYPLQTDGWVLLAAGSLFFLFMALIQRLAGLLGPYGFAAAFIFAILAPGYVAAYMQKIVAGSAMGENHLPDWPDFANWQEDILAPLWQTACIFVICLGPGVLCHYFLAQTGGALAITIAVGVLGLCYLPMAMLAVYMADSISAINPLVLVPAIIRLRGQYWLACLLLAVVIVTGWFLKAGVALLLPIPILPAFVSGFVGLYFLIVELRILGLIHWCNRERLGWVRDL